MCWYAQALLTAEQACRRRFFFEKLKSDTPLLEMSVLLYFYVFLCDFTYFWKHQIDAERKTILENGRFLSWTLI